MIFPECCCFIIGAAALQQYTVPQVHLRDELQERRIEGASLRIDGSTATSTRIRDEHIDPAPRLNDPRHHCLDRLVIADVDFHSQGDTARCLNLGDRTLGSHVLRLGLELLIRVQVEVSYRDFGPQPGESFRISTTQTARRARDDRHLPVQHAHDGSLLRPRPPRYRCCRNAGS